MTEKKIAAADATMTQRRINNLQTLLTSMRSRDNRPAFDSEAARRAFCLPETVGTNAETRAALDGKFFDSLGIDSYVGSLTQHATDMGQFPVTTFVGYGALQQIAQNGMIRNCIKTVADDCTHEWIKITGGADTPVEKIEQLQDIQDRKFHLQKIFNDAICKVGFMGGAFIHIRTQPKGDPNVDLTKPLRLNSASAEIGVDENPPSFIVVDPVNVSPCFYNSIDPLRDDYMRPTSWFVLGRQVHESRLMALYSNEPPTLLKAAYNFLGIPQAQILWDYVNHWNECRVAAQGLIKKLSLLIYYTDMQSRMGSFGGVQELDAIMQVLQHYRDNNSIFVADKTEDQVDNVQTTVSGVQDIVRQSQEMIAAINRTPAVKLFGISPSGFNATGESDIRNYYDHIRSQQELYRPAIQRCLDAIQLSMWGEIDPAITFDFCELNLDNESSKAMNFSARVNALAALKDRNAISAEELRQAVRLDKDSGLDFLSKEMPEDAYEEGDLLTGGEESSDLLERYKQSIFGGAQGVKDETQTEDGKSD